MEAGSRACVVSSGVSIAAQKTLIALSDEGFLSGKNWKINKLAYCVVVGADLSVVFFISLSTIISASA